MYLLFEEYLHCNCTCVSYIFFLAAFLLELVTKPPLKWKLFLLPFGPTLN